MLENRIWQEEECRPRDRQSEWQTTQLRNLVERVEKVPFYQKTFTHNRITADQINSPDDIRRLPFTTKDDLRENYPLNFLAVPRQRLARIHGSSGTTGKSTFVAYTAEDLQDWSNLCARFLVAGGLRPEHVVQVAFGYGLFTGGFGLHYGIEKVGAAVIPAAAGNTPRQLDLLQDLGAEVIICTPSYALNIAEAMKEKNIPPDSLNLQFGHFGGEPWTEDMRRQIDAQLGILSFNNYGLSEVIGPGVSGECFLRQGMHVQEDHFIVECIDPETMEPVAPGEQGELVFTSLRKQAMPLLRYRTRDLATLDDSPCSCGRTGVRMSRVTGRTDDMLIIRGVNVFPSQIEEALLRVEGAAPHYEIIVDRPATLDELTVRVEIRPENFSDEMRLMQNLRQRLDREIHAVTGVRANVELIKPQTLERFIGKAKQVVDRRLKTKA